MASQWLHGEARKALGRARELWREDPPVRCYLHYRRGALVASSSDSCPGFERVTPMTLPMDKSDEELLEWMLHELKSVPCHPTR